MTFVLQLHFVKINLNLKQKRNAKKDVLRFDYLLTFFFLNFRYWSTPEVKIIENEKWSS